MEFTSVHRTQEGVCESTERGGRKGDQSRFVNRSVRKGGIRKQEEEHKLASTNVSFEEGYMGEKTEPRSEKKLTDGGEKTPAT